MEAEFTGFRDWKLQNIKDGDIVITQQGTKFVVTKSDSEFYLVQSNEGKLPDLQGDWFSLERYMQSNLEVIGSIYTDGNLTAPATKQ